MSSAASNSEKALGCEKDMFKGLRKAELAFKGADYSTAGFCVFNTKSFSRKCIPPRPETKCVNTLKKDWGAHTISLLTLLNPPPNSSILLHHWD